MRVIKQNKISKLREMHLTHQDSVIFEQLTHIRPTLSVRLCRFLKDKDYSVIITEEYDTQSGYLGFTFKIGMNKDFIGDRFSYVITDLSTNGFCFTAEKLNDYLLQYGY